MSEARGTTQWAIGRRVRTADATEARVGASAGRRPGGGSSSQRVSGSSTAALLKVVAAAAEHKAEQQQANVRDEARIPASEAWEAKGPLADTLEGVGSVDARRCAKGCAAQAHRV